MALLLLYCSEECCYEKVQMDPREHPPHLQRLSISNLCDSKQSVNAFELRGKIDAAKHRASGLRFGKGPASAQTPSAASYKMFRRGIFLPSPFFSLPHHLHPSKDCFDPVFIPLHRNLGHLATRI
jgi:hypothetical protein